VYVINMYDIPSAYVGISQTNIRLTKLSYTRHHISSNAYI